MLGAGDVVVVRWVTGGVVVVRWVTGGVVGELMWWETRDVGVVVVWLWTQVV